MTWWGWVALVILVAALLLGPAILTYRHNRKEEWYGHD